MRSFTPADFITLANAASGISAVFSSFEYARKGQVGYLWAAVVLQSQIWSRAPLAVEPLGDWARWPGRWGEARAGWVPGRVRHENSVWASNAPVLPAETRASASPFFTAASTLIAIPAGVQIFLWIATIWAGRPRWNTALLFVAAFIVLCVGLGLAVALCARKRPGQALALPHVQVLHVPMQAPAHQQQQHVPQLGIELLQPLRELQVDRHVLARILELVAVRTAFAEAVLARAPHQPGQSLPVAIQAVLTNTGTHVEGESPNGKLIIQLAPFDDTSNNGGVYILAICQLQKYNANGTLTPVSYPVDPRDCKYDAFKIQEDAPSCAECGSIMVRNGSCYKCLNCGNSMGCS